MEIPTKTNAVISHDSCNWCCAGTLHAITVLGDAWYTAEGIR